MSLDGVAEKAIEVEADKVVLVDRWHGGPGRINLYKLSNGLKPVPPLLLIKTIRLRREFKNVKKRGQSSAITFEPESSVSLAKIAGELSQFFGLPVMSLDVASEKRGATLHLSFDRSRCLQLTFVRLQRMVEIGPRVTLSKLIWDVSS
jgi:rRNA maturation protein Rpf1